MNVALLSADNVFYDYRTKSGVTHALNGVSAVFDAGQVYAITGRSGSGKTTLLSLLAGFDSPKSGEIRYNGQTIPAADMTEFRRKHIGMVFQSYNLIPHLTALENVITALDIPRSARKGRKELAIKAMIRAGLGEEHLHKKPLHLSGGEQQRVAIARAMVTDPDILLADEPTGNLDNDNSSRIISLMQSIAHDAGKCVIIVTHSAEIAAQADAEYRMSDGRMKYDK